MKYKIYKLTYKDVIVYVGRTTTTLIKRKDSGYGSKTDFFKKCIIDLIEETDDVSRERYWIEYYKNQGCNLLNIRNGDGFDRKEYSKDHYQKNKNYYQDYYQDYYQEKKEEIIEKQIKYQKDNAEKLREYRKNYYREYRKKKKQ